MKKIIVCLLLLAFSAAPAWAESSDYPLDEVTINLEDKASLQRGARVFVNYCLSCHSARYMRYIQLAKDLGLTQEQVANNLMFTTDRIYNTMKIAMRPEDSEEWFGTTPPDLTLVARYHTPEWLHTYLRTFYLDPSSPTGVNNLVFENTAMPHPLWRLQGWQKRVKTEEGGKLKQVSEGALTPQEYDRLLDDLVNFLVYMSDPSRLQRQEYGPWVLLYIAVFCVVAYFLKRQYWKDIH